MPNSYTDDVIRYAITDAARFGPTAEARLAGLLADAERWAGLGIDFVQLREKTLASGELVRLARAMLGVFRKQGGATKLLINGRADVAIAAGADGVHLTSARDELTTEQVLGLFMNAGMARPVVSASCHSLAEVRRAREGGVDLILFGPVFGKSVGGEVAVEGVGIEALREACQTAGGVRVLALGGVDTGNVGECLEVGAAGIAGIRLFQ